MLLKDKIVVVSGIGPGLGIELALAAAAEGAEGVVVAARTAAKLDDAEQRIAALGVGTAVLKAPTDIADPAQCQRLAAQALERFGRVDALINSAYNPGVFKTVLEADTEEWRQVMDVNLYGTLNLCRAVVPGMKERGGGAIVMINTMVTRKPLASQAGYAASKAALTAASSHLALELGQHGIRVNAAYMGWMWGPPVEGYVRAMAKQHGVPMEQIKGGVEKNIPLGSIPDDADCAKVAIFLASDQSVAMTGACVDVNGGEYMAH